MKRFGCNGPLVVLALASLLGACAAPPPSLPAAGAPAADDAALACALPSNCVSSRGTGDLMPLRYAGTPAQALAQLKATLASFAEASLVRSDALTVSAIFTTPLGFKDQVDFRIDPQAQRIDFRSRSLLGLFDFGKNRSRMLAFTRRFEQGMR